MASDKSISKGQAWFCTTGLPSDIVIEVDEMTFHLHKFPLMSKSRKLLDLIAEQETKPKQKPSGHNKFQKPSSENESEEINEIEIEIQEESDDAEVDVDNQIHITLPNFPGGSEAFEVAAKFCYGVKINLTPSNTAPLRCAGEYLRMTEDFSEDNLISRTERFFSQTILKSIKDAIKALHSCEKVLPIAEDLGIVQRCIDAIAVKAFTADPSLFGWPMSDGQITGRKSTTNASDSWFEELVHLDVQFFKRLIFAMENEDVSLEILESCLIFYAKKHFPGISRINRKISSSSSTPILSEHDQRELLEFVVANLPTGRGGTASTMTRYIFGLLRTVNILKASEACRAKLERKIGTQLDQATLDDLLIPSYSYLNETLYDVECIERILKCFLQGFGEGKGTRNRTEEDGGIDGVSSRSTALMLVGKLVDGYLSEIASDANLKPDVFYQFAISMPDHARLYDDGLYRAVDVYLKAHPWLSEGEREKICSVLNCQKLTLEACTHAAQNERLPLRAVVQVLFFEQLQLRQAIAGSLLSSDMMVPPMEDLRLGDDDDDDGEVVGTTRVAEGTNNTWMDAVGDNQVLRLGMDSMRSRVHQLERECSSMRRSIAKIDKVGSNGKVFDSNNKKWRNPLGCKFKTQVCDSHEPSSPAVVQARKARNNR